MLPSEDAEHGVSSELLTGDLPDPVPFDRVRGLDASL
jgi:hypothetical protein